MGRVGHPVAVYSLVVDEQAERLSLVPAVFHPVYGVVSDDVGDVAVPVDGAVLHGDEVRVVVVSLAGNNLPIVESGREAFQMPFPDDGCLVACLLEQFRKCLLGGVEYAGCVVVEPVCARVFSCEHACPAGAAQRVGHETVGESHAVGGDAVEVRGLHVTGVITAHHLCSVVISHDVDDVVGLFLAVFLLA